LSCSEDLSNQLVTRTNVQERFDCRYVYETQQIVKMLELGIKLAVQFVIDTIEWQFEYLENDGSVCDQELHRGAESIFLCR
jgi:hypothetical protein